MKISTLLITLIGIGLFSFDKSDAQVLPPELLDFTTLDTFSVTHQVPYAHLRGYDMHVFPDSSIFIHLNSLFNPYGRAPILLRRVSNFGFGELQQEIRLLLEENLDLGNPRKVIGIDSSKVAIAGVTALVGDHRIFFATVDFEDSSITTQIYEGIYRFGDFCRVGENYAIFAEDSGYPDYHSSALRVFFVDSGGEIVWTQRYTFEENTWMIPRSIHAMSDGSIILFGNYLTDDEVRWDEFIIRLDADGEVISLRTFQELGDLDAVMPTGDDEFAILFSYAGAGLYAEYGSRIKLIWVTTDGEIIKEGEEIPLFEGGASYFGIIAATTFIRTDDGGFLIPAYYSGYDVDEYGFALVRTDDQGNLIYRQEYDLGLEDSDYLIETKKILSLPDGGFLVEGVASIFEWGRNRNRVLLIRFGPERVNSAGGFLLPPSSFILSSYPNPFNSSSRVTFSLPSASEVRLTLSDMQGRTVSELLNGQMLPGMHQVQLNGSDLPAGVYVIRLESVDRRGRLSHQAQQKAVVVK